MILSDRLIQEFIMRNQNENPHTHHQIQKLCKRYELYLQEKMLVQKRNNSFFNSIIKELKNKWNHFVPSCITGPSSQFHYLFHFFNQEIENDGSLNEIKTLFSLFCREKNEDVEKSSFFLLFKKQNAVEAFVRLLQDLREHADFFKKLYVEKIPIYISCTDEVLDKQETNQLFSQQKQPTLQSPDLALAEIKNNEKSNSKNEQKSFNLVNEIETVQTQNLEDKKLDYLLISVWRGLFDEYNFLHIISPNKTNVRTVVEEFNEKKKLEQWILQEMKKIDSKKEKEEDNQMQSNHHIKISNGSEENENKENIK